MMTRPEPSGRNNLGNRLRKKEILRGRRNLERLFREGRRYRHPSGLLTVVALPNGMPYSRFCFGVGKSQGKSHERNYLRRVLREIVRQSRPDLPRGMDLCLIPAGAKFRGLRFERKREIVLATLREAGGPVR